jgi:high-affinity Fe2+/Pb2+ permease
MPDGLPPEDRASLGAAGVAAGLGCSIVATVVVFIVGGVLVDQKTDRAPIFTLVGVAIALIMAAYQLVELANVGRANKGPGLVTRGIQQLTAPIVARRRAHTDGNREVGEE